MAVTTANSLGKNNLMLSTLGGGEGGRTATATMQSPSILPAGSDQAKILEIHEIPEASSYKPVWYNQSSGWEGRTYDKALSFCANNHVGGLGALCPYLAVCPTGSCSVPIGGVFEDSDADGMEDASLVQWTPLANLYNDWVMVRPNLDVYRTYMNIHYKSSDWGLMGKNS
jgi:hypothetical protein